MSSELPPKVHQDIPSKSNPGKTGDPLKMLRYKRPVPQKESILKGNPARKQSVYVDSEIAPLERLMIHSPDGGIGIIGPGQATELLFEDIVDLPIMRAEYDVYIKLLLHFLDPESVPEDQSNRDAFIPGSGRREAQASYLESTEVLDLQQLLFRILESEELSAERSALIEDICRLEGCPPEVAEQLRTLEAGDLSKTLITGALPGCQTAGAIRRSPYYLFAPVPNLIYTRDLGLVVKDHVVLGTSAKKARKREGLLARFVLRHSIFKEHPERMILLDEDRPVASSEYARAANTLTIEGGDLMMIHPRHLLIGCSERTSDQAVCRFVEEIFSRHEALGIDKVSAVHIPKKRASMHIDTVFTMVRRDVWVAYMPMLDGAPSMAKAWPGVQLGQEDPVRISQYHVKHKPAGWVPLIQSSEWQSLGEPTSFRQPASLRDLMLQVSQVDFGANQVRIIPCGGGRYPWDEREQWTDGANLLALREGVVVGYERNRETARAFERAGFQVRTAESLIREFESGTLKAEKVRNTLITLRGAELVRARGGTHCMSFPLRRRAWEL